MPKLERRVAFYQDGKTVEGKTKAKTFSDEGLIGVVSFFDDGTRVQEELGGFTPDDNNIMGKIAKLRLEKHLEFKHDGGDTYEIKALVQQLKGRS